MSDENLQAFQNLLQVIGKINNLIDSKQFTPSLIHAQVFDKASSLLLGSCGYPTPKQVHNLQEKLTDFFNDTRLLSNPILAKKLKTLIEIAPNASFQDLNTLLTEIDLEINLRKSCKTLIFGMIDKGELFIL